MTTQIIELKKPMFILLSKYPFVVIPSLPKTFFDIPTNSLQSIEHKSIMWEKRRQFLHQRMMREEKRKAILQNQDLCKTFHFIVVLHKTMRIYFHFLYADFKL